MRANYFVCEFNSQVRHIYITFILQMRPYNSLREKSFGQTDKLGPFRPEGRGNLSVWGPERFCSLLMPAKTITYGGVTLGS